MEAVEKYARELINVRNEYKDMALADIYNPLYMPKKLLSVHKKLDRAVDRCYNSKKVFKIDLDRLSFLFELHSKYLNEKY